jgi:hypothetical protein
MTPTNTAEVTGSLWRNRNFVALWSGQVISTLGTEISATALPLLVLALTGGAADAGVVSAAGSAPYLLSLPVGALFSLGSAIPFLADAVSYLVGATGSGRAGRVTRSRLPRRPRTVRAARCAAATWCARPMQ